MPREADPNKRYPSLAIPTQIRLPVLVESLMENRIQSFSRDKDVYNSLLFLRYCSLVIPVDNRIVEFYLYFKKNIYFQILSVKFADRKCVHFFFSFFVIRQLGVSLCAAPSPSESWFIADNSANGSFISNRGYLWLAGVYGIDVISLFVFISLEYKETDKSYLSFKSQAASCPPPLLSHRPI